MFQFLNPGAPVDNVGNHPNAYFKMAFEYKNGTEINKKHNKAKIKLK